MGWGLGGGEGGGCLEMLNVVHLQNDYLFIIYIITIIII